MTIAIYAGTFDPFTLGHEDVLDRARQIFDEVIVAVAADTGRNTFFSFEERSVHRQNRAGNRDICRKREVWEQKGFSVSRCIKKYAAEGKRKEKRKTIVKKIKNSDFHSCI